MSDPRRFRARLALIGLVLLFFGPIVLALWLNITRPGWRPLGSVNHGVLVEPVREASAEGLQWIRGGASGDVPFKGKWTLVLLGVGACQAGCREMLEETRTARRALGRRIDRLQRLLVVHPAHRDGWLNASGGHHRDLEVAVAPAGWLERFAGDGHDGRLFIVDPQGYVIIRYRAETAAEALVEDLERLLKISKIG